MASSLEVTRVVSPCGAVPNERKRRTAGERRKKRVVFFFGWTKGWGMMKRTIIEFVQKILLILNPSELVLHY